MMDTSKKSVISVRNLTMGWPGKILLENVSFDIYEKQIVFIMGGSGCGKSTLLKLLLGFETPTQGKIRYDGKSLSGLDAHSLRRNLGVVLQDGKLIAGSIYDNITITCPNPTMKAVNEVIEAVGLKADIDQMPMDVQTVLSESGNTISGGQQQRIAIARALAMKPELLLFDEPTSALDPELEVEVLNIIRRLVDEKQTIVIITHKMSFAREVADKVVFFDEGKILKEGTYTELEQSNIPRITQFLNMLN